MSESKRFFRVKVIREWLVGRFIFMMRVIDMLGSYKSVLFRSKRGNGLFGRRHMRDDRQ